MAEIKQVSLEELNEWRAAARDASHGLARALLGMELPELALESIAPGDAIGENSLDADFLAQLERGEHLNGEFLAEK